ncbi:MAG TPA: hypothetical protein VI749_05555 [Candidatus Omnitrophota bacterium]|nr:hypothetical protein [Candidatus Omnitrophota bacterium]
MKRALKVLFLGLITSAMLTSVCFAEWVYVTKNGKKYHPENSRFSQVEGVERISKEEAEEKGYEPSKEYLRHAEELVQQQEETSKAKK